MPKQTNTYTLAYDCCDHILTELGRFPTIDLIRERIGVNSPVTIKKAMNEWTQHFAQQHFEKLHRPDLPATLLHSVEQVWKLAVAEAEKTYLQKEQEYRQIIADTQAESASRQEELQFLAQTLSEANKRLTQSDRDLQALQQQLDEQRQDCSQLRGQLAACEQQCADQQALMEEQAQRRQQQQEQDQAWFARRLSEEKLFSEQKWQEQVHRQAQQIAALTESEAVARQLCAGLRQEQQRLQQVLAAYQNASKDSHRFKMKPKPEKHRRG